MCALVIAKGTMGPGVQEAVSYDVAVRTHTVTFGLAYKLDWAGPVVANTNRGAP